MKCTKVLFPIPVYILSFFNNFRIFLQPKYGGLIIDIVSRDIRTPEQQADALNEVKNTILDIFLIVIVGYVEA